MSSDAGVGGGGVDLGPPEGCSDRCKALGKEEKPGDERQIWNPSSHQEMGRTSLGSGDSYLGLYGLEGWKGGGMLTQMRGRESP